MSNIVKRLVSVIIRSMDRPSLGEALASVAGQTHPELEVVVVNATGREHSDVGSLCGEFPLRMVGGEQALKRSAAANAGLDAACGDYALFLDDDDWLEPAHVALLVAALGEGGGARAAYSGVRFAESREAEVFSVMNEAFDPIRLMHGNFIPIHAVLFERSLVLEGCRFDEALDLYEDWDFWLQVTQKTRLLHVNAVTAGYRDNGDSGAGPSAGEAAVRSSREAIFDKWKHLWSGGEINHLLSFATHIRDKEIQELDRRREDASQLCVKLNEQLVQENEANQQLQGTVMQLNADIGALQKHAAALSDILEQKNALLELIYGSTGWKLTEPLRRGKNYVRKVGTFWKTFRILVKKPKEIVPFYKKLRQTNRVDGWVGVKRVWKQLPYEVTYADVWVSQHRASFTPELLDSMGRQIGALKSPPKISVLMPTYNTNAEMLRQTVLSLTNQLYPHWELCVVDDASGRPEVVPALEVLAKQDSRIKLTALKENRGIAAATNIALSSATGDFVVLMDHDDLLEPQALWRVAQCVMAEDPDMVYSDEALLSEDGKEVFSHTHRPAFSLEYLRACPYVVHLVGFKASLLKSLGGLDERLNISQDYDLILRVAERAEKIVHIPEVLYQWRQHKTSAGNTRKKDVMETSKQILRDHLKRCGEDAEVFDGEQFNFFDVRYPLLPGHKVAIIIPTKNHWELVKQCVESIERTVKRVAYDIVVIDHASTDEASVAYFETLKERHTVLRYEGVFNFSAINNWGVKQLKETYSHYLFCNNDIEATQDDWLERMMELCQKPDVGMVGAKLLYPDGSMIQHAGVCVGMYGAAEHFGKFMHDRLADGSLHPGYHGSLITNHEVSAVTAACALMRADAFERIGGYEEGLPVGFGDVDLCLKTREAGFRIIFCPMATLVHHESYTRGKSTTDPHPEDSAFFQRKWRKFLDEGDPYFNPNLSVNSTRWEVRQPLGIKLEIAPRVWVRSANDRLNPSVRALKN